MTMAIRKPTDRQKSGSEYSGVLRTTAGVQPQDSSALTNGEILHLGYATGVENDTESFEDRRQMMGLRPADGKRPNWLLQTGQKSQAEIEHPDLIGDGS
jgi:hypothetical protein